MIHENCNSEDYEIVKNLIMGKTFPCVFAKSSYKKKLTSIISINANKPTRSLIIKEISDNLSLYDRAYSLKSIDKQRFSTIIFVIDMPVIDNVTDFMTSILRDLYQVDRSEWPKENPKSMDSHSFKFFHAGKFWFPILLCKNHPSKLRVAKKTIIAFQPENTFDINKNSYSCPYNKIRSYIHAKINFFYSSKLPYYMGSKSEGKNITQYIGYDMTEINKSFLFGQIDSER